MPVNDWTREQWIEYGRKVYAEIAAAAPCWMNALGEADAYVERYLENKEKEN